VKIKVLGCSGAEMPDFHPPAFLIDERILLDAGTISGVLEENAQKKITHILITHTHLDHIRGIPTLIDNMLLRNRQHQITVVATEEILNTLRENIFNGSIWPDFTNIPSPSHPGIKLRTVERGNIFKLNGYSVIAEKVTHSVPTVGYIIENLKGRILIYTGDTGQTINLWERANTYSQKNPIDGVIIEVTLPNNMREVAVKTGHLTPEMLSHELKKLRRLPRKIFITHLKPQFSDTISTQLHQLKIKQITILKAGKTYVI